MIDKSYTVVDQPSSFDFFEKFPDEQSALNYFIETRWPAGNPICCHCDSSECYTIRKGKLFTCKSCKKQFSVRVGTVMQSSKISLLKWLYAMYLINISRRGISSIQLSKELGITQKSAWFMAHRLRRSVADQTKIEDEDEDEDEVQADEVYIGGKEKNKHSNKKLRRGRGSVGKTPTVGSRNEKGETSARVIKSASSKKNRKSSERYSNSRY